MGVTALVYCINGMSACKFDWHYEKLNHLPVSSIACVV